MWVHIEKKLINLDTIESIGIVEPMVSSKIYSLAFQTKSGSKFLVGNFSQQEAEEIFETLSVALTGVDDIEESLISNVFQKVGHC